MTGQRRCRPACAKRNSFGAGSEEKAGGSWKFLRKLLSSVKGVMHIEFENSSNGVSGTSLDLPNVVAIGDDHDDALRLFHEALREHVAYHERTIEIVAA